MSEKAIRLAAIQRADKQYDLVSIHRCGARKPTMGTLAPPTSRRVAVVGSGPASRAVAEELTRSGHAVVVYEEWPKPGSLLHYGIPSFKLGKDIVMAKIAHLESRGRWTTDYMRAFPTNVKSD